MKAILPIAALAAFAWGIYDLRRFLKAKRIGRSLRRRLEIWEGEGGAVPVAAAKTAAQVSPQKSSGASG